MDKRGHTGIGSDIHETYSGIQDNSAVTKAQYVSLDITNEKDVMDTILSIKPDAIIHCAAWTAVDLAEDDDKVEKVRLVNVKGTENIAKAAKAVDCKCLYLSTDYVFDGQGDIPWDPDCKDYKPLNVYGQTKLEGELKISSVKPSSTISPRYITAILSAMFATTPRSCVIKMMERLRSRFRRLISSRI